MGGYLFGFALFPALIIYLILPQPRPAGFGKFALFLLVWSSTLVSFLAISILKSALTSIYIYIADVAQTNLYFIDWKTDNVIVAGLSGVTAFWIGNKLRANLVSNSDEDGDASVKLKKTRRGFWLIFGAITIFLFVLTLKYS